MEVSNQFEERNSNMKSKGLSFVLAIAFIISCLTVFVSAAETDQKTELMLPDKVILSTGNYDETVSVITKNLGNKQISWNIADEDIVDIDPEYKRATLRGLKEGFTKLTVNAGTTYSNTCEIEVVKTEKVLIKDDDSEDESDISLKEITLVVGQSDMKLIADYIPGKNRDSRGDAVQWTSTAPGVVKIDTDGNLTAKKAGEATIRVNIGEATETCKVTVLEKHKIKLDDSNKEMINLAVSNNTKESEKGVDITVTATPTDSEDFYIKTLYVLGENSGDEIDRLNNKDKTKGAQKLTFEMPDEEVTVFAEVEAFDPNKKPLEAITIVPEKLTMPKGTKYALKVKYIPEDTTEPKDVTWSSVSSDVVSVDENGIITALKEDSTAIVAKVGKKEATINVTVDGEIDSLKIDSNDFSLKEKEEKTLKAKYTPISPVGLLVEWTSSNEKVAKVDADGKVTGVGEGTATITAKVGDETASVKVTVSKLVGDYNIIVRSGSNGKVETSVTTADKGDIVVLTVKPDEGYSLGQLSVVDNKANPVKVKSEKDSEFTFEMPDSDVVVTAAFSKKGSGRFVDVPAGIWYEEAVNYVADKGYLDGVGNNRFDPNGRVTRGQLCTILYAMEGKPLVTAGSVFPDVAASKYYYDPVRWAATNGMVAGYTDGTFKPEVYVSRQQLAAVLHKYTAYKGFDTSATANIKTFADYSSVSNYAVTPLSWAVSHKVMSGTNTNRLEPLNAATRAEFAVMLKAYDANVRK